MVERGGRMVGRGEIRVELDPNFQKLRGIATVARAHDTDSGGCAPPCATQSMADGLDELPENMRPALLAMMSTLGLDPADPASLRPALATIMMLNSDKAPGEREGIDREAGDWDSDDPADDNVPWYANNRKEY